MKYIRIKDLQNIKALLNDCRVADDIILVGDSMEDMRLVVMDIDYFNKHFYKEYISFSIAEAEKQVAEGKTVSWEEVAKKLKAYIGESIYRFELDDYSAPTCTSSTKSYFGSPIEFEEMLDGMDESSQYADDLKNTFLRFIAGDINTEHNAGLIKTKFASVCSIIKEREWSADNIKYRFENSYGFYYDIKTKGANFTAKALTTADGKVIVVYKATIKAAEYKRAEDDAQWSQLGDQIWGHPGVIKVKKEGRAIELSNTLAVLDSIYDRSEDAERYIDEMTLPNLQTFFEDVFGDG